MKRRSFSYDQWIVIPALILSFLGLLMVASSSMVVSDKIYGHSFHYIVRQSVYFLFSAVIVWLITKVSMEQWYKRAGLLMLSGLLLLIIVLIPGIGRMVNGSRRWLNLVVMTIQVSEWVKLIIVIYMASYLTRYQNEVREQLKGFVKPMILLSIISFLLLLEPDFGATSVIVLTVLSLLFIAGLRLRSFLLLTAGVGIILATLAFTSPYRLMRIVSFLHPWDHAFDSGYQLTQSLIAFGRGGFLGVGLGNSVQKLYYLPEAHTDFIFAVLAEELGLLGELLFISVFMVLVARMFYLAQYALKVGKSFHAYISYGMGLWLSLQCFINIGVNCGLLPTKGLTLPFMSYGGSSLLITGILLGIVLRIAYELNVKSSERLNIKPDQVIKQQEII